MPRKKTEHSQDFRVVEGRSSSGAHYRAARARWARATPGRALFPAPLHVDIELTNVCDIDCVMCERRYMKRPLGMMTLENFKRVIRQCVRAGVDSVKLNLWGESVLNRSLVEMVRYAKENSGLILQFNTNANRMTPLISRGLVESGLDRITISLDGVKASTYAKIRRKGDFKTVTTNVEALLAEKKKACKTAPHVTLQMIRMKDTLPEVDAYIARWKDKVDAISITNIGATAGSEDILKLSVRKAGRVRRVPCPQLWQRLSVFWNGDVTVCCNDYQGFLKIGNVFKTGLLKLWRSARLNEIRAKHKRREFLGLVCDKCVETCRYAE